VCFGFRSIHYISLLFLLLVFYIYFYVKRRSRNKGSEREREIYKEPINFRRVVCVFCVLSFSFFLFYLVFFQLSTAIYRAVCSLLYIKKGLQKSFFSIYSANEMYGRLDTFCAGFI
jgi:Na+/H+ antiporter NhaD/arsenite permease-like protein